MTDDNKYKNTDPHKMSKVVAWTHHPSPRDAIHDYLKALNRHELICLMEDFPGPAGTLAWLEVGRRHGVIPKISFDLVEVKGKFEANIKIPAPVVVENITLEPNEGDGDR